MEKTPTQQEKLLFFLIFILVALITFLGLPIDLIDPDAALYATISKTILETNDFINLYSLGHDWLDKPHLPFWITAISFKIFGVSNWSYKLPAILIFFFGIWMTFKFAKNNYSPKVAYFAALILATSSHSVISNFDVKAEPYLTAFIISSIYFIDSYLKKKKIQSLIFACFFCALAIMTKGIFAMIPIIAALIGELLLKKNWKQLLNPIWILAFFLIFIFILPELIALYIQFDLHPEKIVFKNTNTSGIRFFFWDSQFGRFFNTAPIKGSGDIFFFLHTILWAFLPWGILFYLASFFKFKDNFSKISQKEEFYTISGSLFTILIFSLSKFQLAHYTNIVFPFMAIIVANFLVNLKSKHQEYLKKIILILKFQNIIILLFIIILTYYLQPQFDEKIIFVIAFSILIIWKIYQSKIEKFEQVLLFTSVLFLTVYGYLFTFFYPTIIDFQGGSKAAKFVNENFEGKGSLIDNRHHHFGFEFYLNKSFKRVDSLKINEEKGRIFYLDKKELDLFDCQDVNYEIVKEIPNFQVSKINLGFIDKKTRNNSLEIKYLVKINQ